uniref:Putative ENTH/VHS/GAT family protein n=1 Tax=Davidia involucrata TaxID=16924 RepID=A0A5B7AUW4_DAVIN
MKLWKRASGALKDQNSILIASLSRRTSLRNPDIESAVIKSTSHDESHVDYRNAHRVFAWIRMSPAYLRPFVWALCMRMEKTRSWVVALKGLILMHGVFCCRVPAVKKIGRLPFDLSNFKDGHMSPAKSSAYNAFVRAYYAFLDQKSAVICMELQEREKEKQPMLQELLRLQKLQGLIDILIQIKPLAEGMNVGLVFEAMDCVIIEIYDIYSRICNGIARVLVRICLVGKVEAMMALRVLQKATKQGEELSLYFEICRDIGVLNARECPKMEQIPEEDIRELECIINGVSQEANINKAIVVRETPTVLDESNDSNCCFKTVITDNWEVFDDHDLIKVNGETSSSDTAKMAVSKDPFAGYLTFPAVLVDGKNEGNLPDLISFL